MNETEADSTKINLLLNKLFKMPIIYITIGVLFVWATIIDTLKEENKE